MIKDLFRCLEDDCAVNQDKGASGSSQSHYRISADKKTTLSSVVILGSYHFRGALAGWTGGEDLWCVTTARFRRVFWRISKRVFHSRRVAGRDRRYAFEIVDPRPRAPIIDRRIS